MARYVAILDRHGRFYWLFEALPPLTREEVLGTHPWDWATGDNQQLLKNGVSRCLVADEYQEFQVVVSIRGRNVRLMVYLFPVPHAEVGAVMIAAPIPLHANLLSRRQTEVLTLMRQGLITKQIAARLGISLSTVQSHRTRAKATLGMRRIDELIAFATDYLP